MNESSSNTLDSTRQLAQQALERASTRVKDLRSGVQDLASRSLEAASGRASAARNYVGEYASASTRYVSDNPLRSALIAAAIGAAVAGLVLAARSRRDNDKYF